MQRRGALPRVVRQEGWLEGLPFRKRSRHDHCQSLLALPRPELTKDPVLPHFLGRHLRPGRRRLRACLPICSTRPVDGRFRHRYDPLRFRSAYRLMPRLRSAIFPRPREAGVHRSRQCRHTPPRSRSTRARTADLVRWGALGVHARGPGRDRRGVGREGCVGNLSGLRRRMGPSGRRHAGPLVGPPLETPHRQLIRHRQPLEQRKEAVQVCRGQGPRRPALGDPKGALPFICLDGIGRLTMAVVGLDRRAPRRWRRGRALRCRASRRSHAARASEEGQEEEAEHVGGGLTFASRFLQFAFASALPIARNVASDQRPRSSSYTPARPAAPVRRRTLELTGRSLRLLTRLGLRSRRLEFPRIGRTPTASTTATTSSTAGQREEVG